MNPNVYIGTTGQTMYIGNKEVLSAFTGEHLIFPIYDLQVMYEGTGNTVEIISEGHTSGIDYIMVGGRKYPEFDTTFTFQPGQEKVVYFRGTSEAMCSGLTSVVAVTAYTSTPMYGFSDCTNLTGLTLDTKGQVKTIGSYCFNNCTGLTLYGNLIPGSVDYIDARAFFNCTSITGQLYLPVTGVGYESFYWCSGITQIVMDNRVTKINVNSFYGCSSCTALTISTGLTEIPNSAFMECPIYNLYIPDNITRVKAYAFNCGSQRHQIIRVNSSTYLEEYSLGSPTVIQMIIDGPFNIRVDYPIAISEHLYVTKDCDSYYNTWLYYNKEPNNFECYEP